MSEQTQSALSMIKLLKRDPLGKSFSHFGADGVFRVFHSVSYEVIDAVRMSTAQIKEFLERSFTFDQATEDQFRGVDGRGVPDEDMFNPPEGRGSMNRSAME